MADGTYIIDLAFGTWQNQIWLCDKEEADSVDRRWTDAKQSLEEVGEHCANSNEFFNEAVKHFEKFGFVRIQR